MAGRGGEEVKVLRQQPDGQTPASHCSFCGKGRGQVKGLVASGNTPGVAICDECVGLCVEVFGEQPGA